MALADSSVNIIKGQLEAYGLGNLTQKLVDFLEEEGFEQAGAEMLLGWLEGQPEFHARFPALKTMRAAKMPVSVQDILTYEKNAKEILKRWGVDVNQTTNFEIQAMMAKGVSPAELNDRFEEGYRRVAQSPPEVRAAFDKYFANGNDALAKIFMSGFSDAEDLLQQAEQAEIMGRAAAEEFDDVSMRFVQDLTEEQAGRYSMEEVDEAMQSMSRLRFLTNQLMSEGLNVADPYYTREKERVLPRMAGATPLQDSAWAPDGLEWEWYDPIGEQGGFKYGRWRLIEAGSGRGSGQGNGGSAYGTEVDYAKWREENGGAPLPDGYLDRRNQMTRSALQEGYRFEDDGRLILTTEHGSTYANQQELLLAASLGDGDAQREVDKLISKRVNAMSGESGTLIREQGSSLGTAE